MVFKMPQEESTHLVAAADVEYGSVNTTTANKTSPPSSHKSIGYIGSLAIAVNSLAGPAILQLPFQYQRSGLIPTTLCLIGVGVLSYFCSMHTASVISKVPHNQTFDRCIEFSDPFRIFWKESNNTIFKYIDMYTVTQVLFFLCTVCLNVAAIVDTAQVVDSFLGLHFEHKTFAWNVQHNVIETWSHPSSTCTRRQVKIGACDPFSNQEEYGNYILTLGYVLTTMVFLPICLMDLKENTNWQILGFAILLTVSGYFCVHFATVYGLTLKHVSLWGDDWGGMLGVIMFNFTLVLAIPAWLNEKKPNVKVRDVVAHSTVLSTLLYIFVGSLGACAIPKVNVNMLSPIVSGAFGSTTQAAGSVFAFFIIGLDIPLFSVLTRYNLTHSGLCSEWVANLVVVWIPWSISWIFYQGDSIGELLQWGGVLLTSAAAFILPLVLALKVLKSHDENEGSVHVYGNVQLSHSMHVQLLSILLGVATASVVVAIVGQVITSESRNNYLHSPSYINGTLVLSQLEELSGRPFIAHLPHA